MEPKDIEGNVIAVGDEVYYARKRDYTANGQLVKMKVSKIIGDRVIMGRYMSSESESQIVKVKK